MNLPDLAIKRPIFITCMFSLVLVLGFMSLNKLGVDLFPNVTFPVIVVTTPYPGAGPNEVETLISKPLEDSLGTLNGLKSLKSVNADGVSTVIAEFSLETDFKYAEQQLRDRVSSLRAKMPSDSKDPNIKTIDPADQPIVVLALSAKLGTGELFDLADNDLRPLLEQVTDVGFVDITGGRKREIEVLLDRDKLKEKAVSATQVSNQIAAAGKNIPAGKSRGSGKEADVRTLGEFESVQDIGRTLINFYGNETPVRVSSVGEVVDSLEEEKTRTFVNGHQGLSLRVYRRSGANTIAVVNATKKRVAKINSDFAARYPGFELAIVRDGGKPIQANVDDVTESILIGIVLTVLVVFFFLGSARSTLITGIALPNSLLGAFILMAMAGFTINIMTMLALSLAVGLLIDDAIVVRENIFRHIELGETPMVAASVGAQEVTLAVVATTMTVIAVFGPVAFLSGIVGQFFKQFGLTVCFAMLISLMDSLTMAPMLSAYFAGNIHAKSTGPLGRAADVMLGAFDRFQTNLETKYVKTLKFTMDRPFLILGGAFMIFVLSFFAFATVPKTFVPAADNGEFSVSLDMPPGTDLESMAVVASGVEKDLRTHPEVLKTVLTVGGQNGEANAADIFVQLVPAKERKVNTSGIKELARLDLKKYPQANSKVQDISGVGGAQAAFNVNIIGAELKDIEKVSTELFAKLKGHPDLKDVDISYRPGKPEFRVSLDKARGENLGVSTTVLGQELRTLIQGSVPAVYREKGQEYDIRVRLKDEQKNLKENFSKTFVPNINNRLIRLSDVARPIEAEGPSTIYRQDRGRYIQVSADLNPKGNGMGQVLKDVKSLLTSGEIQMPPGVHFEFVGQAQDFQDLGHNMMIAAGLSVLFIFLVLASLYESFITPLAIMLVLPLAACGAFYALAITRASFDIFSMIGCIMLLGIATKNSILLVDATNQLISEGVEMREAIIQAGKTRLRPIIMTSVALIAGMLPVAIGLNEASKQRTSMGISIIGGLISSTVLTLVVVPAAYAYVEKLRRFVMSIYSRMSAHVDVKS